LDKSTETLEETTEGVSLAFRWRYIIAPVVILLLSAIVIIVFYGRLPDEVAYRFQADGSPDKLLSRGMIILLLLLPQLFLTLLAGAITWGMSIISARFMQRESTAVSPERIMVIMGNMIGLPQLILFFAMLDIFSYNSYQIHLLPLWVFALIIMVIGGIVIGILFFQAIRQAQRAIKE
jgi:uncharacterized membrane protein